MNFCKFFKGYSRPFLCDEGDPEMQKACSFYYAPPENKNWCFHCYDSEGKLTIECFSREARHAAIMVGEKK